MTIKGHQTYMNLTDARRRRPNSDVLDQPLAPSSGGAFSLLDLLWRATRAPYLTSLRATFAPHHTSLPATLAPRLTPLRATHASLLTPLRAAYASLLTPLRAGLRTSRWGSGRDSLRRLRASGRGEQPVPQHLRPQHLTP